MWVGGLNRFSMSCEIMTKKMFPKKGVTCQFRFFSFLIHFIKKTPILIAEAEVENNGHLTQPSCVQVMLGFVQNVTPKLLCFIKNKICYTFQGQHLNRFKLDFCILIFIKHDSIKRSVQSN